MQKLTGKAVTTRDTTASSSSQSWLSKMISKRSSSINCREFYYNRLTRIMPVYWICNVLAIGPALAGKHHQQQQLPKEQNGSIDR